MSDSKSAKSGMMTINLPGVIKTLGKNLYSDPAVSFRELLQNAHDACVIREQQYPDVSSEIHVRYDMWKRQLIVEDNGAGMTAEECEKFLTVIGSSNTADVRERLMEMGKIDQAQRLIGRFGLGLLSAFIIGDRVEFLTLSCKPGSEAVWWACDGGTEYQMSSSDEKTTPGTVVTVHIDPDFIGMLKEDRLTSQIRLYADLLTIPIYLDPIQTPINVMQAPWDNGATEAEYRSFIADRYQDACLDIIPVEVNEDDGRFRLGGALFIPKQGRAVTAEYGDLAVYAQRMFVQQDDRKLLPAWAKFVRGIVESPNLVVTTSREALVVDENHQRVQKTLGKIILDRLTRLSIENSRLFKEIVSNHNLVIKAWALVSDELFDQIKDIVLFSTDAGLINLQRYFELSRRSTGMTHDRDKKSYIYYFTTPGGASDITLLYAAKGLRVIDAQHFPDEGFLRKYAESQEGVVLRRLDSGGSAIFEDLERRERKWAELEEEYARQRINAKVVRFVPEDVPAVLMFAENEPVSADQVEALLNDPNLSSTLKDLVRTTIEERDRMRKGRVAGNTTLYLNAANSVVERLADLDLGDTEIQEVMIVIYNNALMLSAQGAKTYLTPQNAKKMFEANNRAVTSLMNKIYEVRDLRSRELLAAQAKPVAAPPSQPEVKPDSKDSIAQSEHITCFVALPFRPEYDVVIEALRDVLEAPPYFWQVETAARHFFANDIPNNVSNWIARAHCYAADISDGNDNVMMELGYIYWGFSKRPLLVLQRSGAHNPLADLGGYIRIEYPWDENKPDRQQIAKSLREQISKLESIKKLKGNRKYLSSRLMNENWISAAVAQSIAEQFETVEEFVSQDDEMLSRVAGSNRVPPQVIKLIQDHVRSIADSRK